MKRTSLVVLIALFAAVLSSAPATAQELGPHLHLVFADTGDPEDPCHTGSPNMEVGYSDEFQVLACYLDSADEPIATDNDRLAAYLTWTIEPVGGGEVTATRFVGDPPKTPARMAEPLRPSSRLDLATMR